MVQLGGLKIDLLDIEQQNEEDSVYTIYFFQRLSKQFNNSTLCVLIGSNISDHISWQVTSTQETGTLKF